MMSEATGPLFTGVGVALLTLFGDNGDVDAAATADHAARLVDAGVTGVLVAGTTGESPALDAVERAELVRAMRKAVPQEVPVLAGTGAPSARQAIAYTKDAAEAGATAALVMSPPRTADSRRYYTAIHDAVGDAIPLLGYHFPAVTPPGIAIEHLPELPIVGLKDSTGDPERLLHERQVFDRDVYVGSAAMVTFAALQGATGAILAIANVAPEQSIRAWEGDAGEQQALLDVHLRSRQQFPHGIKGMAAERFGTSRATRMG